jgi:hypothetical protein
MINAYREDMRRLADWILCSAEAQPLRADAVETDEDVFVCRLLLISELLNRARHSPRVPMLYERFLRGETTAAENLTLVRRLLRLYAS